MKYSLKLVALAGVIFSALSVNAMQNNNLDNLIQEQNGMLSQSVAELQEATGILTVCRQAARNPNLIGEEIASISREIDAQGQIIAAQRAYIEYVSRRRGIYLAPPANEINEIRIRRRNLTQTVESYDTLSFGQRLLINALNNQIMNDLLPSDGYEGDLYQAYVQSRIANTSDVVNEIIVQINLLTQQ